MELQYLFLHRPQRENPPLRSPDKLLKDFFIIFSRSVDERFLVELELNLQLGRR